MTTPTLFKEYIWLVNTIRRAERITFAEIQAKWIDAELHGSRKKQDNGSTSFAEA